MGPGVTEDCEEGEVAEEDDSSLGELWAECLALEWEPMSLRL